MSADLYIHVMTDDMIMDDFKCFFSNHIGSIWWDVNHSCHQGPYTGEQCEHDKRICDSPQVWIGSVSWLKASFSEDGSEYMPGPVVLINDLIDENLPILNKELERKILAALSAENDTKYSVTENKDVKDFLKQHYGKKLFVISW